MPSFLHTSTFTKDADSLPSAVPDSMGPNLQVLMPNATMKGIRKFLGKSREWPLRKFLEDHHKILDVEEAPWAASSRVPGTFMRRLRFRMPMPDDVPPTLRKLVRIPDYSLVTYLARLGCTQDQIVLLTETCSHEVTYGESFWVRDVLVFSDSAEGGVLFEKFTSVRWVNALPWYASAIGTFIEMKAKGDAEKQGRFLVEYLKREHGM